MDSSRPHSTLYHRLLRSHTRYSALRHEKMSRSVQNSPMNTLLSALAVLFMIVLLHECIIPSANAFAPLRSSSSPRLLRAPPSSSSITSSTTSLFGAMNKGNGKFNKQKDLAAKMAEAKRLREIAVNGGGSIGEETSLFNGDEGANKEPEQVVVVLSSKEIKLRNDQQRFADMLENSMQGGGDLEKGYYLTEQQEDENADAVFQGIVRLYEGDPAPTSPFAELLNIQNGEAIGKGGMKRLVPWEGSNTPNSKDYLVVITDPRPKSLELRTAMKRLAGALSGDALKKCVVINTDSPGENRRFLKKNFGGEGNDNGLRIFCDENMEWMREYTALGEKRFSMTMFVLRDGRVEKIAREVEAEVLSMVVLNAIRSLS